MKSLTFDDVFHIVSFIRNYAEDLLPGCIPEYKRSDLQLLPCSTTESRVWKLYQFLRAVSLSCGSIHFLLSNLEDSYAHDRAS